jgi:uncharacterized metal-binding protein
VLPEESGANQSVIVSEIPLTDNKTNNAPETALFVCFGSMSNVGILTGLAGLEVMKQVGGQKACVFCLGGLPTQSPSVVQKTAQARRIVTVDGCAMNCARKIVEKAGHTADASLNLVTDCGIPKRSSLDYSDQDLQTVGRAILGVIT